MGAGVTCQLVPPQQPLRELPCLGNLLQAASILEEGASLHCCILCSPLGKICLLICAGAPRG